LNNVRKCSTKEDRVPAPADLRITPESPGFFTRPDYFEVLARLRREAPIHEYAPGSWTVARYADVRTVSRDPQRFCSSRGALINDPARAGQDMAGSILHMDPPDHVDFRKLVSREFTLRPIRALEQRIRELTCDLLDALPTDVTIDLVESVAAPLPLLVIADMLGIPAADTTDFRRWSDATIESTDRPAEETARDLGELVTFLLGLAEERRHRPGDDLTSLVVTGEVQGRRLDANEALTYLMTLLVAGNETTRHLIAGSLLALDEHRDQRTLLVDEPGRIPDAVEECLRWVTPIQAFGRTATTDTELDGTPITEGDFLVMLYASANRDEQAWGDGADRFDVTRPLPPGHLAFGVGEHFCLGAGLARLEARVLLTELLARFPAYELTDEPTLTASTLVRGPSVLPAVLTPNGR
jgi:cytochrome P450